MKTVTHPCVITCLMRELDLGVQIWEYVPVFVCLDLGYSCDSLCANVIEHKSSASVVCPDLSGGSC